MINSGRRLWFVLLLVVSLFLSGLSPAFAAWTAPVELNAIEDLTLSYALTFPTTSSFAVQKNGVAHVIYPEKTGKTYSIIHQTNKTGSWRKEIVKSSTKQLSSPAVAVIKNRLYLAWARGAGRGSEIVYATNAGGVWSAGRMTDNSVADVSPAIAVRRGKVYISWIQAQQFSRDGSVSKGAIRVRSNAAGRWRIKTVGDTYVYPGAPVIKVDGGGAAHIVYTGHNKFGGLSLIFHAENTTGKWRQERLRVNVDRAGHLASAEMPSLALYKGSVYVAFMKVPRDYNLPHIVMAVKKAGAWRVRGLTKKSPIAISFAPQIAVHRGRVKLAYSKLTLAANDLLKSGVRYLELVNGRVRGEVIDGASITIDPFAPEPPPITVFMATGFDDVRGVVHAAYLRATLDLVTDKVSAKLFYTRNDP